MVLTNIGSGTSLHVNELVKYGAIDILAELLSNPSDEVVNQTIWALANIAGDSTKYRDLVLKSKVISYIPEIVIDKSNKYGKCIANISFLISNLCRGKPKPNYQLVVPFISLFNSIFKRANESSVLDALWALSYITESVEGGKRFQKENFLPEILKYLSGSKDKQITPALRIVGNIVTGDDLQTQWIIDNGIVPILKKLLTNTRTTIRKEACWTISNITAGSRNQIQVVIDTNIFPTLIQIAQNDEFKVKKEALWCIANTTSGGSKKQIKYIVKTGCLPPLLESLETNDRNLIVLGLEAICNIVEKLKSESEDEFDLISFIDSAHRNLITSLQVHQDSIVVEKATTLLSYLQDVDETP